MAAYAIFDVEIRDLERCQYDDPVYRDLKALREQCSSTRLVAVEGALDRR